ncbi:HEAT repeat domain-containing protein [Anabaena azotica]|uniref:HEAT repeat domain-containing protein n=1 Tax=Anabaena azotica FACHB-119 TaxID=947527 RepID=A0ABR8CXQ2_9NOST|nr:HEAT repeat domain-containing protein [Anabaena azotica]MBD2499720.1 HEAT repeat domain-containing protein [Anabaena azotica FACHB-119]
MNNIGQLLAQAKAANHAGDWSSLINYLQQLILVCKDEADRECLLELALSALEMGDFQQRWDIAKVLISLGNITINPLIEILQDEDAEDELRWFAARILGEFPHPDVINPLVGFLQTNQDEELKAIAASSLGQMGTVAIPQLTELLKDEQTRLLAVRSLAYIRSKETITPLLTVVQDSQVAVRTAALEALSSFHDERVAPVLLQALDDLAAPVRRAAIVGLSYRLELCTELDLIAKIKPHLYDFNIEVCCATAVALARMGDDAAQHLFTVLVSPHTPITLQLEIIRALSWLESLIGLEYLQQALNQLTSATLWQEIITLLGRVQKPELKTAAAEIILQMVQAGHPATKINSIKSAIALALGQLSYSQATELLNQMQQDPDEFVRLHAIAALNKLG